MIYVVGSAPPSDQYRSSSFTTFLCWITPLIERHAAVQLDVETVAAAHWKDKHLRTIQFGKGDIQWVIQPQALTREEMMALKNILQNKDWLKIIHNAYYEVTVFKMYGIHLDNVFCTFLAEKILWGGYTQIVDYSKGWVPDIEEDDDMDMADMKGFSLEDVAGRRCNFKMDKDETIRMTFGPGVLTERHVVYAAQDVVPLEAIMRMQIIELTDKDLTTVAALEMDAVISYSEMTAEGMELDVEMWRNNIDLALPLVDVAKEKLDAWLDNPDFGYVPYDLGYISDKDRVQYNWNSHQQKALLMKQVLPDLPGTTKPILKRYVKDLQHIPERIHERTALNMAIEGDMGPFDTVLLRDHREWLIQNGYLVPAGTSTINWNSRDQVLPLFQLIDKSLDSLSKDALGNFPHAISDDLQEYKNTLKLTTSFGEAFIQKHVERDGRVRAEINQIVNTGRMSVRNPNMQQIPAKESVGNRYRNCFMPPKGWKMVDSDYASQELVMIAFISQDPVWLGALRRGEDLHSVCAELVFEKEWKRDREHDCAYYEVNEKGELKRQKCKCKKHKTLRTDVKTINFGLAYGMSEFKLARTKQCPVPEAKALIKAYFEKFPRIKAALDHFGKFAVTMGYIKTLAPFKRKRWFPKWVMRRRNIQTHLKGIKFDGILGEIQRAGMNTPIQGGAADIAKLSVCMIRWYIEDNQLRDRVKMVMQVHDQDTTIAREDYAETWKPQLTQIMREAGAVVVTNGLLDAETNITDRWSK